MSEEHYAKLNSFGKAKVGRNAIAKWQQDNSNMIIKKQTQMVLTIMG